MEKITYIPIEKIYPHWGENEKLDCLYDCLTALGYQMSDEEKALQDGTHELFMRGDNTYSRLVLNNIRWRKRECAKCGYHFETHEKILKLKEVGAIDQQRNIQKQ